MSGVGTAAAVLGMGGSKSVLHGDLLAPANTRELQAVLGHMEQSYKKHRNFSLGNVFVFDFFAICVAFNSGMRFHCIISRWCS